MRTKNMHTFMQIKKYITNNHNKITIVMLFKAKVNLWSTLFTKFIPKRTIQVHYMDIIRHIIFKH